MYTMLHLIVNSNSKLVTQKFFSLAWYKVFGSIFPPLRWTHFDLTQLFRLCLPSWIVCITDVRSEWHNKKIYKPVHFGTIIVIESSTDVQQDTIKIYFCQCCRDCHTWGIHCLHVFNQGENTWLLSQKAAHLQQTFICGNAFSGINEVLCRNFMMQSIPYHVKNLEFMKPLYTQGALVAKNES